MKQFGFYIDQKIITWERIRFSVEAGTKKDAIEKASVFLHNPSEFPDDGQCEILHDAGHDMDIEENEGCATRELFYEDGKEIANNAEQTE
jgi:hypothetical protein